MARQLLAAIVLSLLVQLGAFDGRWAGDLVPTTVAAATQENPSPPAQPPVPVLQSITRLIVFLGLYSLIGALVGKALASDFQWSPGDARETVTFAIAFILAYTLSAALSLTPSIGPYLGNMGAAHGGRGTATEYVLGVASYWATVAVFVVLVFQLASVVTYRPAARMFVLLVSLAVGQLIHTRLLSVMGLPRPDKDGFAAFFTATVGSAGLPNISSGGGFATVLFRPLHALISYVDTTVHDLGASVVLSALLFYFAYSFLTYGIRRSARVYQQELAWVNATYSGNPQELGEAISRLQARNAAGCVSLVALNAFKLLFLVALYYFFVNTPDFRNIQSVFPVTDLSSPPRGRLILSLAALSVVVQAFLQSSAQPSLPLRFVGSLFLAGIVATCAYFAPAGMVLVLTTMTLADTVQSLYESRLPRQSVLATLIPALVVIPLAIAFIPRGVPGEPQRPVAAAAAVNVPATPVENAAPAPKDEADVKPDSGAALADRVAELTGKGDFTQALDLIDAELVEHPANEQFKTVKVRTLEEYGVKQLSDRHKAAATFEEAHRLDPRNESVAALLATIYVEAGEEDLRGACVRNEPAPVAPVLATMSVGDMLTRRAADPAAGWVPVDAGTGVSGWILASLIEETPSAIQVKRTIARDDVYKSLTTAMEMSPKVRNRVLWIKYKMLLIPAGLVLAIIYVGWRKFAGL